MTKRSDIIDLIMRESTLLLDSHLIELLHAKVGDRIEIGYVEKESGLIPVIHVGDSGNKLSGKNTIVFKGKQRATLAQFGSNFWAIEKDGLIELEGDGLPIYTEVKKAVEAYMSKEIILDTNYNITKLENYAF